MPKNELRSRDIVIKLIIENSKHNNQYLQNENNSNSSQIGKFVDKDCNNFVSLNRFKVLVE